MTKHILAPVFILAVLTACQRTSEETTNTETSNSPTSIPMKSCYRYISERDSVRLQITPSDTTVSGSLIFNFYEKDQNKGTIAGHFRGDTLFADYTFFSEGTESVREVAFLKKGEDLVEGYAAMEEKDGKMVFTDRKTLDFNEGILLKPVPCE